MFTVTPRTLSPPSSPLALFGESFKANSPQKEKPQPKFMANLDNAELNPQAFPFACQGPTTGPEFYYGMTLRDYFASNAPVPLKAMSVEDHCAYRYRYADAMLAERAKS
jgi:hypothetical protein